METGVANITVGQCFCCPHARFTDPEVEVTDGNGDNSIIIVSGANLKVKEDDVESAIKSQPTARVVVCQNEINRPANRKALLTARSQGVLTIYNPAPADAQDDCIALADIVCPNETELEALTGTRLPPSAGIWLIC